MIIAPSRSISRSRTRSISRSESRSVQRSFRRFDVSEYPSLSGFPCLSLDFFADLAYPPLLFVSHDTLELL